ncbi:MAG: GtrA family protein [Candidatus Staskawiczbacteria bacterium]|jgi:putative flippase GtrA
MTKKDIIFAIICGLAVTWIASDFLSKYFWIFFIALPVLSVIGLWVVELIGKKFLFVHQLGKFVLAGGFADVVDIKVFQFLFWLAPFALPFKVISFFVATFVKYVSDKYWSFEKHEMENVHEEIAKFFMVAIAGAVLNVASFYFFGKIKTGLPFHTWQEASIILAALVTAVWNFCGYKFIVFKK